MTLIFKFTQVFAWQKAHELALEIYRLTSAFPKQEVFGLVSQMRRAAVSVSANIAEGFRRASRADQNRFYNIAAASLEELRAELLLARDLGYFPVSYTNDIIDQLDQTGGYLARWIRRNQ